MERIENDGIAKRVYVGECAGIHSVGRLWKRWIDTVKVCLRKGGLGIRQARRMVYEREYMGSSLGNELLTLMRCHSCGLPQLYEALEGWKSVCGQAYNLNGIKGKISVFLHFLKL